MLENAHAVFMTVGNQLAVAQNAMTSKALITMMSSFKKRAKEGDESHRLASRLHYAAQWEPILERIYDCRHGFLVEVPGHTGLIQLCPYLGAIICDNPEQHQISNTINTASPRCTTVLNSRRKDDAEDSDEEADQPPTEIGAGAGKIQFSLESLLSMTPDPRPDEVVSCAFNCTMLSSRESLLFLCQL